MNFRSIQCFSIGALMAALTGLAQAQPPAGVPESRQPFHYYNGDIRVERLLALDEVVVESTDDQPLDPGEFEGPGRSAQALAQTRERVSVRFDDSAPGRSGLNARAQMLRGQGRAVRAVAYGPGGAPQAGELPEVITDRLSVKLVDPEQLADVLEQYDLELEETFDSAYILRTQQDDLMAAVETANALYESGLVDFATPLIARKRHPRLIPNDSLFPQQWHLRNTGQVSGSVAGNDVNIVNAWDTYTGSGVNVAVTDTGVLVSHDDLSPNARTDIDVDILDGDGDPTPHFDEHGTGVAGIAAAAGNNTTGVTGAGFHAGIVGIRLIEGFITDQDEANAMKHQLNPASPADRVHINNNSWGPGDTGNQLVTFGPMTEDALEDGVTVGRGGRGIVYVWAAGNGRSNSDNVNYDGYASSRYTIAVGASGGNGGVSSYSEPGAALLVNAPSSYGSVGTTTTWFNQFFFPTYISGFGGTSSSAPLAAGCIALMLEANPNLGWRDVQHILVDTAFRNDPGNVGWRANGSGRVYNHNYGFGRVDATAAANRSVGWVNLADATPLASMNQPVNATIPDNSIGGLTSQFAVNSVPAGFFVEHVEVVLNATHSKGGHLSVELISPAGTVSTLATPKSGRTVDYSNWKLTSVAHWGENPAGVWSLKLADRIAGTTGTFKNWKLIIYGTVLPTNSVLLDPDHVGFENGHANWPYNDLPTAVEGIASGGTINVVHDITVSGTTVISKPVTLESASGIVRISGS